MNVSIPISAEDAAAFSWLRNQGGLSLVTVVGENAPIEEFIVACCREYVLGITIRYRQLVGEVYLKKLYALDEAKKEKILREIDGQ